LTSPIGSPLAAANTSAPAAGPSRLLFVDNIRWVLIVLVICHHAAVTYSHVGGWYYLDGPKPPLLTGSLLALFETFNQAYFMGILFLIAGYFVPAAFDSKGFSRFLRDRAVRLGIPTLFFMLVIHPFTVYWLLRNFDNHSIPPLTRAYSPFLSSGKVFSASGPMWFAAALLIFCIVYGLVRGLVRLIPQRPAVHETPSLPGHKAIIGLILLMGGCSFLVRITQPVGVSILNMQPCYFSQYILLFVVGVLAYRGNWLLQIPHSLGIFWLKLALSVGVATLPIIIETSGALRGDTQRLLGGFHWQSAAFCFWEAFFCLGMCLGLIVVFRERFNSHSRFSRWMARNSFSAYLFHTPLLVAVTLFLRQLPAPAAVEFFAACLIAVPVTFAVSGFLRSQIPGLRRLL
jgi:glucan biosynthesis protein C